MGIFATFPWAIKTWGLLVRKTSSGRGNHGETRDFISCQSVTTLIIIIIKPDRRKPQGKHRWHRAEHGKKYYAGSPICPRGCYTRSAGRPRQSIFARGRYPQLGSATQTACTRRGTGPHCHLRWRPCAAQLRWHRRSGPSFNRSVELLSY